MKRMNLPDPQELVWLAIGVWVTFFLARMVRARDKGIASMLMYLFLAAAPPLVIIFQEQFVYWLQQLREMAPKGG
jgi:hypothetical protein